MKFFKSLKKDSFLLKELVKKGIRLKYRRSYFGILWSLIEPLLTTIILVIVFGTLFHNHDKTFPLYIVLGRLCFSFFQEGSKNAMKSIRTNASMIKKIYVPKLLYPLSSVIFTFIIFLISLIVLIGVDIYCKVIPTIYIFQFLLAISLLFLITLSTGIILCVLNVFFRDIEYIWNVVCMIIMYMSAIFYYPETILYSSKGWILKINPLFHIITLSRDAFLGNPLNIFGFVYTLVFTLVTLALGGLLFYKLKDKFVFQL